MSTFRDAIRQTINRGFEEYGDINAEDILAMPEMEAIRMALLRMARRFNWDSEEAVLINFGLHERTTDWVLGAGDE